MADDKLNTNPQENTPPDVAALLGSDASPEHEQAVISGMGEDTPAPAGKVINLSELQFADNGKKDVPAHAAEGKAPEADKPKKRRGRPPKEQAAVSAGKKEKAAEPRTGRPSKVDKAAREEAPPSVRDKVVCSQ